MDGQRKGASVPQEERTLAPLAQKMQEGNFLRDRFAIPPPSQKTRLSKLETVRTRVRPLQSIVTAPPETHKRNAHISRYPSCYVLYESQARAGFTNSFPFFVDANTLICSQFNNSTYSSIYPPPPRWTMMPFSGI